MSAHTLNLPWSIDPKSPVTILDCHGMPVAMGLRYTSIARRDNDGVVYNSTDYAGAIRARLLVALMNKYGEAHQSENGIPDSEAPNG